MLLINKKKPCTPLHGILPGVQMVYKEQIFNYSKIRKPLI